MKKSKRKFNLILYSVIIVVLVCAIVIGGILFKNVAVAWFAKNMSVNANGMAVSLKDLGISDYYYVRYDMRETTFTKVSGNSFTFRDIVPGETVTIKAVYLTDDNDTRTLDIHFMDMGGGERPLVKDGKYYYFGTQLRVTKKVINGGTAEELENLNEYYLVTPPTNKIYYQSEGENAPAVTANDIILAQTLALPQEKLDVSDLNLSESELEGKAARIIEFTITFENYPDVDQNDYQNFGKGAEQCLRHLVTYVIS